MSVRRYVVALAVSALFLLGACSASPEEQAKDDCGVTYRSVSAVPGNLAAFKKSGGTANLGVVVVTPEELEKINDPELKKLAEQGAALGSRFNEATDPAARDRVVADVKPVFEAFRKKCDGVLSVTAAEEEYSQILAAGKMPTPDEQEPVTGTTPEGTTVKLGESVLVKYTDVQGRQGKVEFAVTAVDPMPGSDYLRINRNKRNSYGAIKFVRYNVKEVSDDRPYEARPNVWIDPVFTFGTSGDQQVSTLTFGGQFETCKEAHGVAGRDLCTIIAVPKDANLETVELISLSEANQQPNGKVLYRWTVG